MKTIIAIALVGCFSVSFICGASIKTWREVRSQYEEQFIPAELTQKSLKELGELNI